MIIITRIKTYISQQASGTWDDTSKESACIDVAGKATVKSAVYRLYLQQPYLHILHCDDQLSHELPNKLACEAIPCHSCVFYGLTC